MLTSDIDIFEDILLNLFIKYFIPNQYSKHYHIVIMLHSVDAKRI